MAVRRRPARGAPGQHFLRSSRLAAELVRAAGIRPGNLVVDVGAGTGVLTSALADVGAHVVALEADSALAAGLRRRFDGRDVSVVEADATRWSWPKDAFSVVSNLPFAGSGAILRNLLRDPRSGLSHADVIVQWEFAQKHSAVWPTTLRGAYWQAWFEVAIVAGSPGARLRHLRASTQPFFGSAAAFVRSWHPSGHLRTGSSSRARSSDRPGLAQR